MTKMVQMMMTMVIFNTLSLLWNNLAVAQGHLDKICDCDDHGHGHDDLDHGHDDLEHEVPGGGWKIHLCG